LSLFKNIVAMHYRPEQFYNEPRTVIGGSRGLAGTLRLLACVLTLALAPSCSFANGLWIHDGAGVLERTLLQPDDLGDSYRLFDEGPIAGAREDIQGYSRTFFLTGDDGGELQSFVLLADEGQPSWEEMKRVVLSGYGPDLDFDPEQAQQSIVTRIPVSWLNLTEAEGPQFGDEARWLQGGFTVGGRRFQLVAGGFLDGQRLVAIKTFGLPEHASQANVIPLLELLAGRAIR
jgi:hypothetical protein